MSSPTAAAPPPKAAVEPEVDLGPFRPPPDFAFERELAPPAPRPIPKELRWGPWASDRRKKLLIAVECGAICLVLARLGFVQDLAPYFLPLGYLDWLGGAFLGGAAIAWLVQRASAGRFKYVALGQPVVARVTGASIVSQNAVEGMAAYQALYSFETKTPGSDEIEPHSCLTDSVNGSTNPPPSFELAYQRGDYATAVYLKSAPPGQRMKLYACLGLNPGIVAMKRAGRMGGLSGNAVGALIALLVAAILGLALFSLWANQFHGLVNGNEPGFVRTMLIGGVATGAVSLVVGLALLRRGDAKPTRRDYVRRTIWAGGGGGLLGAMFLTLGPSLLLNAKLDDSEPYYEIVQVANLWQTTHNFLLREYSVEYRPIGDQRTTKKISASFAKLNEFEDAGGRAALAYRAGAFGWRWIEDVHPVVYRRLDDVFGGPIDPKSLKDGDELVAGFFAADGFHEVERAEVRFGGGGQ